MKSILVFNDEEFYNIRKAADTFSEWGISQDKDNVEKWIANLINEVYNSSVPCPEVRGWTNFFFQIMSRMTIKMTLEEN